MTDEDTPDIEIDPTELDFVDRSEIALQKIRDVVTGNLFHPLMDVELISYEEVFLEFEARLELKLHAERTEKFTATTPPGVLKVNNKAELDKKAEKEVESVIKAEAPLNNLKEEIYKREDKGYFWDGERIPLPLDPLIFLREEPCQECRGQKYKECKDCGGRGHVRCSTCGGNNPKQCNSCKGKGEKQCVKCATKGKRECHQCRAVGRVNHLTMVKLFAETHFSYDKENVPEVAIPIIERLAAKLLTKGHAMYALSDDIKAKNKESSESFVTFTYEIKLPLGDAIFRVGDEKVPALLFGYKCALLDVPPFLERYMLTPFNEIREAAMGQGNLPAKIRAATFQTRLTNEAVIGVATAGAATTERRLKHDYSIALEPEFIHNLIRATRVALNKMMMKPQMVGMSFGLIPTFILTLIYVFVLSGNGTDEIEPARLISDVIFLLISCFIPYFFAQIMSRQSLIYALGHRVKRDIRLPKLGIRGYLGPIVALFFFLLFSTLAYNDLPASAPELYTIFRDLLPF